MATAVPGSAELVPVWQVWGQGPEDSGNGLISLKVLACGTLGPGHTHATCPAMCTMPGCGSSMWAVVTISSASFSPPSLCHTEVTRPDPLTQQQGLFIASAAPFFQAGTVAWRVVGGGWCRAMARHNFLFTASALRGIRLQREWLEWEDWRQAVARRRCRSHKNPAKACARLLGPRHRCRDPTVHSALFDGDLQRVQALFQDEEAANGIMATVSNQLAWSAEQGRGGPSLQRWGDLGPRPHSCICCPQPPSPPRCVLNSSLDESTPPSPGL